MKRRFVHILLALSALFAVSGCDFFRTLAGRPTSAQIESKRQIILAEEAAHQARLDSLRKIQKQLADSLELIDKVRSSGEMVLRASSVKGLSATALDKRYYVVVGTFGQKENAVSQLKRAAQSGYTAVLIPYRNGFTAVGVGGSDSLSEAWDCFGKVKGEPFCPKDVWLLVNE